MFLIGHAVRWERATQASPLQLAGEEAVQTRLTIRVARPAVVAPVGSGAGWRRGGRAIASIRERFEQHRLQQSPISQRLDQEVTASIVLMDLDATATGDALGVK